MEEPPINESRLLSLPGELRNRIYRLIALHPQPVQISAQREDECSINYHPQFPKLALTCKTTYNEIKAIFYEENTFHFTEYALRLKRLQTFRRHAGASANRLTAIKVTRVFGVERFGCRVQFIAKLTKDGIIIRDFSRDLVNEPRFPEHGPIKGMCECKIHKLANATKGSLLEFLAKYLDLDGVWKGKDPIVGVCRDCRKYVVVSHEYLNSGGTCYDSAYA